MSRIRFFLFFSVCALVLELSNAQSRNRVVISSDFPPLDVCMSGCAADHTSDPDDVQSMVRFLLYANEFDVEGLIASSGTFANIAKKQNILDIIGLYDKVDENLRTHDAHFPTVEYLRSVTFQGRSGTWGGKVSNNIGSGKDSEASDSIISIVDKPETRPVWFCFWGDCSNLAQAIWKVQNTRSADELKTFLSKIRVYQIAHQDSTIDWMLNNFPDLFIIYSNTTYQGIFGGPNDPLGNITWLDANIRHNHGPLGLIYPKAAMGVDGLKEGDSPSFMYLISAVHGLNNPEDPSQESWGGQYVRSGATNHWVDGVGGSSISKWETQYQAEFALRASWMLDTGVVAASTVLPSGDILNLVFNEEITKPEPTLTLSIKTNNIIFTIKSIERDSLNLHQLNIKINEPIIKNEVVEISYTSGKLMTILGKELPAFTYHPVNASSVTKRTGINTLNKLADVFPNPCYDFIKINTSSSSDNLKYQLTDVSGRVIKTGELKSFMNSIAISDLPNGNYFISISSTNNILMDVKQVVKL
jgi:hypothetical protein